MSIDLRQQNRHGEASTSENYQHDFAPKTNFQLPRIFGELAQTKMFLPQRDHLIF